MDKIQKLLQKKKEIVEGVSAEVNKKVFYDKGMFPPRERIEKLLDPGSFFELDMFATHQSREFGMGERKIPSEGVITGHGEINGRAVCVYAQDFSALGGSFGEMTGKKICALMDKAAENGVPIVGICHSGGLRLHEALGPERMFGELFRRNTIYSGVIPQISIVLGIVAGGQAYSPGLTDFILMTKDSSIYIAGPAFVKAQTGVEIGDQELGGANAHATKNSLVDIVRDSEEDIFQEARRLIDFLPLNCQEQVPSISSDDDPERCDERLNSVVPKRSAKSFDMHGVITPIFDNRDFFETKADFAKSLITGFARLAGDVVGVVANQPKHMGGVLDINASEKAARFVRFCDCFNIPIVTFQDCPAYLIGKKMEEEGIIYRGAKLLHAYAEATVPKVTILVRKAYAGSYIALGSQYIGADFVYAWPGAEISSVAAKTVASIIFRKEILRAENPEETEAALLEEYYEKCVQPFSAASLRHINDIIEPKTTRPVLIKSLKLLKNKKQVRPYRKHGNIPL
jgi:acetyl-CoA carboxylase carboxyltransferase component